VNTTWRKVWRDLAHSKARTLLVVLSIAVSVFALGAIFGAYSAMQDYLAESHAPSWTSSRASLAWPRWSAW
jgi:cell division protein FtsX